MDQSAPPRRVVKMHGLGNDFVILDARPGGGPPPGADLVRRLADRHRGIGCDTVVHITPPVSDADAAVAFFNADGSAAAACGNATRCVAKLLMADTGLTRLMLDSGGRRLDCRAAGAEFAVNMGHPGLDWRDIPLAGPADTAALPLPGSPAAVAMPNPHCIFFVEDAEAVDLAARGAEIEHNPLFPDRTNVEFVTPTAPDRLRMRVWERGGMITQACGSGACAVAVAAHRRGLTGRRVAVDLDGGPLAIDWRDDGVWMTGAAAHVADIHLDPDYWPDYRPKHRPEYRPKARAAR